MEEGQGKKGKGAMTEKVRDNPWMAATAVLALVVVLLLFTNLGGGLTGSIITGSTISGSSAGEKLMTFYESEGIDVTLDSIEQEKGLYKVNVVYQGRVVPVYMTKDGSLAGSLSPIILEEQDPEPQTIPKSDKPKVELFVMTHCPYGTQAEKGFIPAIKTLGDTIDGSVKFVHYFLHEREKEEPYETPRQICIREEQPEKFLDYLTCFLEEGNSERCVTEVGIDETALNNCVNTNADEYYSSDSELSKNYDKKIKESGGNGIGSPLLAVNGEIISSGRSAAAYLDTICQAFNNAPEVCGTELSTENPSPGFGYGEGEATAAQC